MVQIIDFFPNWKGRLTNDWTNQDLAEFYRVEAALSQGGLPVETERGFSDEGDPWIVFCRKEDGEPFVHFARIDGRYVVAAPVLSHVLTGSDLREIIKHFVAENPVTIPVLDTQRRDEAGRRENVLLHPAALITVFVATILIMSLPKESLAAGAGEADDGETVSPVVPPAPALLESENDDGQLVAEKILLIAAVAVAVEMARQQATGSEKASADLGSYLALDLKSQNESPESLAKESSVLDLSKAGFLMGSVTDENSVVEAEESSLLESRVPEVSEAPILPDSSIETGVGDDTTPLPGVLFGSLLEADGDVVLLHAAGPEESAEGDPYPQAVSTASGGGARAWLEHHLETAGLHIAFVSEEDGLELAELVDKNDLVPHVPDEEVGIPGDPLSTFFDDAALRAILHFVNSDDDIAIVSSPTGSILIFDQSDLASAAPLTLRTWTFDDDTVIGILGHSETVADALAMAA